MKTAKTLNTSSLFGRILGTNSWNIKVKWAVNRFTRRVNRLIEYIPVIWQTDDYDYSDTVRILMHQLNRQAKFLENRKTHVNWQHDVNRIQLVIRLLDIGIEERYSERTDNKFQNEFGSIDIVTKDIEGTDSVEFIGFWWSKAETSEENDAINAEYSEQMNEARYMDQKAFDLAWKIIQKDIQHWWN